MGRAKTNFAGQLPHSPPRGDVPALERRKEKRIQCDEQAADLSGLVLKVSIVGLFV